jgi:hypothetical protein
MQMDSVHKALKVKRMTLPGPSISKMGQEEILTSPTITVASKSKETFQEIRI